MKPFQIILVTFFLLIVCNTAIATENLLKNPDFEDLYENLPVGWQKDTWIKDRVTTHVSISRFKPFKGKNAVSIVVTEPDDSKLIQEITVKPNSLYYFSCKVRAEKIPSNAKGANISVLGITETSRDIHDTFGDWEEVSFYGITGDHQEKITFSLRVGGYGSLNKGKAEFDDCAVQSIKEVPQSAKVIKLFPDTPKKDTKKKPSFGLGLVFITAVSYLVLGIILIRMKSRLEFKDTKKVFYAIIVIGSIIRVFLAYNSTGFPVDINTYKAWAEYLATKGFSDFYTAGHFIDYPPFYMYVFYLLGKLRGIFGLSFESSFYNLILKLPSIIAEVLSMFLLVSLSNKKQLKTSDSVILLTLFSFNPVIIIDSSLWGQIDSFLALFILGFLIALIERKLILAGILFSLSIMIKPQALVFTPIFVAHLVSFKDIKIILKVGLASVSTILPLLIPFSITEGFSWIPRLINTMFTEYPFATLNTFNLYALIGKNWAPIHEHWLFLPFKVWGFIAILLITMLCIYMYFKSRHEHKIVLISLITVISVFMFSIKMHERYMVTSMVIFALSYILTKDIKVLYLFIGFSITNTLNLGYPLVLAHNAIYHIDARDFILRVFSGINLFLYILTLKWILPPLLNLGLEKGKQEKPKYLDSLNLKPMSIDLSLNRKDAITLTIICCFFTALYVFNLGSPVSPQTYWQPKMKGEAFIVELQRPQEIGRINLFGGIGKGIYRIDASDDLLRWHTVSQIETKDVFQWKHLQVNIKTRYIALVVLEPDGMLYEIGLFDNQKNLIKIANLFNITSSPSTVGSVKNLFDEQHTVTFSPSYMNGTYFDEIYYARTAFEYIYGLLPYEITHPPLGKLIIASGIKLFGMTPFGWRIMGALSGVLLIAFVYLMGRMLFGSIKYGTASAIIMGFDFMTFVQSRIATIDSFSVLFIVMTTYFMLRFYFSEYHKPMLINLSASGLFFSLGVSTKWLCFYTGVGLALVFLYRLYNLSKKTDIKRYILYGVLFFVILPIIIYSISYMIILPKPLSINHLTSIIEAQYHMYQYHKSIKGSHPFASTWWQWPIIYKPMWLYMAPDMPKGKASSIVTMGNPLIWWAGVITFLMMLYNTMRNKKIEPVSASIILFIAVNYLTWVLIPRETYIYHFFATLPFWVLTVVYCLKNICESNQQVRYIRHLLSAYIIMVIVAFIMFYPILSGLPVDKSFIRNYLQWFNTWIFFIPD